MPRRHYGSVLAAVTGRHRYRSLSVGPLRGRDGQAGGVGERAETPQCGHHNSQRPRRLLGLPVAQVSEFSLLDDSGKNSRKRKPGAMEGPEGNSAATPAS